MTTSDTEKAVPIGIPDDDPFEGDEPIVPGWEIAVSHYFRRPGDVGRYDYDFGDGWRHELTLEAILLPTAGQKYPRCVGGARACPPEDCGGAGGYEELLRVIQTPEHDEHESILQWLGGAFDPERFDPRRVRFDDPAHRYELAFGKPMRRRRRARTPRR